MDQAFDSESLVRKLEILNENLVIVGKKPIKEGETLSMMFCQWGRKHPVVYTNDLRSFEERVKTVYRNTKIPYEAGYSFQFLNVKSYGCY